MPIPRRQPGHNPLLTHMPRSNPKAGQSHTDQCIAGQVRCFLHFAQPLCSSHSGSRTSHPSRLNEPMPSRASLLDFFPIIQFIVPCRAVGKKMSCLSHSFMDTSNKHVVGGAAVAAALLNWCCIQAIHKVRIDCEHSTHLDPHLFLFPA